MTGFAANNISETYDAKIFSVATLLSSYLIYNSVKVCRLCTGGEAMGVYSIFRKKTLNQSIKVNKGMQEM